jgi:PAS domain S-box-containing protein
MRILLVEDNSDHRELMRLALTGHDSSWKVEAVASGEEALRLLSGGEVFDVVFLDYSLPGRDGLEVLEEIRRGEAPPLVVMVTGRGDEQVAVKAMKGGAYDYVVKQEGYLERLPVVARHAIETQQLAVERKRAEEALQKSEAFFKAVTENSLDSILILDKKGTITYASPSIERLSGYKLEELIGKSGFDFILPADLPRAISDFGKAVLIKKNVVIPNAFRCRHKNGSERVLEGIGNNLLDYPLVTGFVVNVRDITDRKRMEESERRNREVAERLALETAIIAEIGRVVGSTLDINQVYERVATETRKLIPYDRLLVNRTKTGDDRFMVAYVSGIDNPRRRIGDLYPSKGTTSGVVMRKRSGILVQPDDAEEIKDLYPNLYETFKAGLRSTMSVPLISMGEVIGSMNFRSKKLKAYTEQDLRLAERIGMQIAGAIVNAQLFNDLGKTEKSLRESEERLRLSFVGSGVSFWEWFPESGEIFFDQHWAKILGYEPGEQEFHFEWWENNIHPESRSVYENALNAYFEGRKPRYELEYQIKTKTGEWKWIWAAGECVEYTDNGKPKRFLGTHLDITERKLAEEALKESEEKFGNIFKNDGIGKSVTMLDGTMNVNPAFCQMLGYTMEELTHEKWQNITHPDDIELSENQLKQLRSGEKKSVRFIKRYLKKDGSIIWADTNVVLQKGRRDNPLYYITSIMDITERKRTEEEIQASLQEKELLLREIHHRVKNNMQVISGLLDLQASLSGNPELIEMLNESQNQIRSMALVHEKLYGSKDFSRIDLAGYVRSLSQDLFHSYKINPKKIDLTIQTDGDVYVDINKAIPCGLILNELISNALKHAFSGDRHGELQIIIHETKNTEIKIVVRDNGFGLPDDVDIHQPRTVGLHLVNGLVKNQLDGQIEVRRDNGTEIRITFPL